MQIKDIVAILLTIVCAVMLGASYFIGKTSSNFQSIFSWCTIVMLGITALYLYFVYLRKR